MEGVWSALGSFLGDSVSLGRRVKGKESRNLEVWKIFMEVSVEVEECACREGFMRPGLYASG